MKKQQSIGVNIRQTFASQFYRTVLAVVYKMGKRGNTPINKILDSYLKSDSEKASSSQTSEKFYEYASLLK